MDIAIVSNGLSDRNVIETFFIDFAYTNNITININFFNDCDDFLNHFHRNKYTLIILDIFDDSLNGVDTAKTIRDIDKVCGIIFITCNKDYMLDAFSCHAFDYLIKPIEKNMFLNVLDDFYKFQVDNNKSIDVISKKNIIKIMCHEIICVTSDAHYIDISLIGDFSIRTRLTSSQFLLATNNDERFLTINKGIVINLDHVTTVKDNNCILTGGLTFPIKFHGRSEIEKIIFNHLYNKLRKKNI